MIVKGGARTGKAGYTGYLARHLQRTDTNELVTVRELRGVAAADLRGALEELAGQGAGTRCAKPLYHANIDPHPSQPALTEAQKDRAVELLEQELGLEGQPRAVIEHVKDGRPHLHVVWGRIDLERMVAISDGFNYRAHETAARALEREFGHQRVQGAHVEREDAARPERRPSDIEQRQAERSGITPEEAKALVTGLWRATDSGQAFVAAIEAAGWIVAKGDKRDFVVVDPAGETHSLARRVEGAKAKEVRERMADLDSAMLPSAGEAKERQEERARDAPEPSTARVAEPEAGAGGYGPTPPHGDGLDRMQAIVRHADRVWEKAEAAEAAKQAATAEPAREAGAQDQQEPSTVAPEPQPDAGREQRAEVAAELKSYGEARQAEGAGAKAAYLASMKQRAAERQEKERRDRERGDDGGRGRDR